MPEARSRLCLPRRQAALSVEDLTVNGQAPAHHLTHGKTATVDTDSKTADHPALTDLVVGMTGGQIMTTDVLHHRHPASGDLTGATV